MKTWLQNLVNYHLHFEIIKVVPSTHFFYRYPRPSVTTRHQTLQESHNKFVTKYINPMSSSKSNKIRTVLGEYKVGKTLGEGSFSKVKLATHTATGEKVTNYIRTE